MKRLVSIAIALTACNPTDSSTVTTDKMAAEISITVDATGKAFVQASLWTHPSDGGLLQEDSVYLTGDDALVATADGRSVQLAEQNLIALHDYVATFNAPHEGQRYEVALERSQQPSAPSSVVTVPAAVTLSPLTPFSRAHGVTIQWAPSGSTDQVHVSVDGVCATFDQDVKDTGQLAIPGGAFTPHTMDQANTTCDATVAVMRVRTGTLDPAYGQGGSIVASQEQSAVVSSSP
jgi:hypothetical protein